ncbi:hypothetical protein C343_04573 [Cryptococcus neoformans C23]|uniref:Uncharacterized protein n=1 Tax=Cryptococcus neoformans (strain H99 / ATCC 208821 / CBS 10515 / FGSC 9487) TaxID=235443 RepID=J9VV45_CRYN9|nr:hypothetical protein CNAG_03224 [Cryptococcus neoformans var. grubii H99]AUB26369.1 hypothetical protein CKF44_03224 [Cryptococcus neoformans var. grubii]OWZ30334.1 hypothetical protein C347_04620 [Cryptococcus neoformans var. grubii AD2-60a]OWZ42053.1 hypothetical protein C343_04573 [Cryptococcus neoformans var. grubii C23]OXC83451.1 hypothetical protein C344_04300 [Cryptococcus neoformans var. grubii AD1-7a]OXG77649.1 hypothetical protein C350_04357 [Cryptococcus neoformans var. grubii MW|eukprot:XP_012051108.1 hypothetical protein CNAG_03224 [Cryptococcus neoformans var. grubii H99]
MASNFSRYPRRISLPSHIFFVIMRKKISLNTSLSDFSPFPTASPEKIFYYDAESMSSKASISMGNPPHWPRPPVMSDISIHGDRQMAASSSTQLLDLPSVFCSGIASSGYTCFSPTSSDCMCRLPLDLEWPSKPSWNCELSQSQGDYTAQIKDLGVYLEAMKDILITTRMARRTTFASGFDLVNDKLVIVQPEIVHYLARCERGSRIFSQC